MLSKTVYLSVAFAALSISAQAQGFTGGELTIDAAGFSEGDSTSVNYSVAAEYSISRSISIAGTLGFYDYSLLSDTINSYTLHGIYHLNDASSLGFFTGSEELNGASSTFYGFEGGFESAGYEIEGYFALYDNADDTSVVGLSGSYAVTDQISAIGEVGFGDFSAGKVRSISAGAEYQFINGPSVYAEIGNVSTDVVDSGFIGLGASIQFGADRGTTFNRRGVFETLNPGF